MKVTAVNKIIKCHSDSIYDAAVILERRYILLVRRCAYFFNS